jgi:hypothetical protein
LPRQARDKHGESAQKRGRPRFLAGAHDADHVPTKIRFLLVQVPPPYQI